MLVFLNAVVCLFSVKHAEFPKAPEKSKEKLSTSVKAESCHHVEVKLPGDAGSASVDLLVFGVVAKLLRGDKLEVSGTSGVHDSPAS